MGRPVYDFEGKAPGVLIIYLYNVVIMHKNNIVPITVHVPIAEYTLFLLNIINIF